MYTWYTSDFCHQAYPRPDATSDSTVCGAREANGVSASDSPFGGGVTHVVVLDDDHGADGQDEDEDQARGGPGRAGAPHVDDAHTQSELEDSRDFEGLLEEFNLQLRACQ